MNETYRSHQTTELGGAQERSGSSQATLWSGRDRRRFSIALAVTIIASASLASTIGVLAAVSNQAVLRSSGVIASTTVGVYSDSGLTTKLTSIDWGTIYPGASKTVVAYVKNEGTVPITLALSAANWSPSTASSYMTLSWDYSGAKLNAGANVKVTLTLTVSSSITGITSFSFDVVITGSG